MTNLTETPPAPPEESPELEDQHQDQEGALDDATMPAEEALEGPAAETPVESEESSGPHLPAEPSTESEVAAASELPPASAEEPAAPPPSEMVAALEAILFVAGEPLARERLLEVFEPAERAGAARALEVVLERYRSAEGRGIMAEEVGGGVRLVSRPELHGYVRRFFAISGRGRLSMAALETLAIIAYRQPLTGPEVAELRGVQPGAVIKTLLERRLIRIAGRKQVVGKPFLYATTREFLLHFGLGAITDLPPLEEMEDFFAAEGSGEAPAPPDREEEIERAVAALADREEAQAAASEDEGEDEGES